MISRRSAKPRDKRIERANSAAWTRPLPSTFSQGTVDDFHAPLAEVVAATRRPAPLPAIPFTVYVVAVSNGTKGAPERQPEPAPKPEEV
jgi:hypothetical protein